MMTTNPTHSLTTQPCMSMYGPGHRTKHHLHVCMFTEDISFLWVLAYTAHYGLFFSALTPYINWRFTYLLTYLLTYLYDVIRLLLGLVSLSDVHGSSWNINRLTASIHLLHCVLARLKHIKSMESKLLWFTILYRCTRCDGKARWHWCRWTKNCCGCNYD